LILGEKNSGDKVFMSYIPVIKKYKF